jgi:PAS domain S-box-containing protein
VLVLTAVGFLATRALGELDARHDSSHRAEIAATRVRDRVAQATTLVDGVRRFLAAPAGDGITAEEFADVGTRWLGPVGLPAAAWVEQVAATSGTGPRGTHIPATLVTGSPPMSVAGVDLGGSAGIAAAVARPETAYRVTATPLRQLADGTTGLFLVQSAQLLAGGVVEPGFVVLFLPSSWLLESAADSGGPALAANPRLRISVGGGSAGDLGGAASTASTFAAGGQRIEVRVPRLAVHGAAEVLPWMVGGAGLVLAVLAGALGVISGRRARATAELDRLFTITPDVIVVAGFDGYFRRVNPAFEALLGYTQQEALGRPYFDFIHPDDRERTTERRQKLRDGETTAPIENRYVCKDGSYRWIEWTAIPVHEEGMSYAVGRDVSERRQAETDLREAEEHKRALADEQAALRRVATLVARGVPSDEMFAAVTEEVGQLLPVTSAAMGRVDPDGMFVTVAAWSTGTIAFPAGKRWLPEGKNVMAMVVETGRQARIDDFADASGPVGVNARAAGYRSAVGTPIVVEGRLWGVMTAASTMEEPLPADTEDRLASFTELVATAIANTESRAELRQLAEEQAALRRVATLVAEGVPPAKVFSALCDEVNRLLGSETCVIVRLEADGSVTIVADGGIANPAAASGSRVALEPGWVLTATLQTGRRARKDDYGVGSGRVPGLLRDLGVQSAVAVPIVVEGALWGAIVIGTLRELFPHDTEQRLDAFTELAATAISNAESRSELAASRARIVTASDEVRRRIERDLHDGTQQRLVSLSLELRVAESAVPAELAETRATIGGVAGELNHVIDELREISRGIHPAILSEGGLGPALRTLARRAAIPVVLGSVIDHRLPEPIEVAAYYVVSEALTNATKHANAERVMVEAAVRDSSLRLSIRDEGVGGADPAVGSGLVGLRDRLEALGGSIEISSPPGQGTQIVARLPVELDLTPAQSEDGSNRVPASQ